MEEKKKEQKAEQVIMIPTKEYRKLCRKIERLKLENANLKIEYAKLEKNDENHYRWWQEEEALSKELQSQLDEAHEVIKGYKESAMDKLGLNEEVETLAEFQFEKGVDCSEQSE